MRIHINIGSNRGDRRANIARAVALIVSAWPEATHTVSEPVVSAPWGYDSDAEFLNVGLMLDGVADEDPEHVLHRLLHIEHAVGHGAPHRAPDGSYCDRPIDIDLIAIDRKRHNSPVLTLPHPRAAMRAFVMEPLRSLDEATARWIAEQ
ncbi:MAG: 2-amino-4-hydroxy-6-hydroxymethyldihydropteridine diphosphokinase [Muribaculaceae bacterium]|nr:2-amino-4-hydroxy-6-hydroxymethyldihydropteridine diphosphokinase [Muribaculaceae bacterium]